MTDIHPSRRRDGASRGQPASRRVRSRARLRRVVRVLASAGLCLVAVLDSATGAWAQDAPLEPGVSDLTAVVNNIRIWLVGILFAVSTLYLTIGGFRYMWSNGDPGEVEKAKSAFRNAAIGYGLAVLAPLVVTIVTSFLL